MQSKATSPEDYIAELPEDRKKAIAKIRSQIRKNIPKGFKEGMGYGMIGYSVPHSLYPEGYHCNPAQPLPFIGLASQKNYVSLYHMGLYDSSKLADWFKKEYQKRDIGKLDMGKCCVRFKNVEKIPFELIGELASKITVNEWIAFYEKSKPVKK